MTCRSPAESKFKNACLKPKHSPKELKDKIRKNYKEKVKNCRDMLLDRFRGPAVEELSTRLTEIYKCMHTAETENDEIEMLEEIKNELVQEELEWWLEQYEKSHVDWPLIEEEDDVICPLCQKCNFILENSIISCPNCKFNTNTPKSLAEIKASTTLCVETHNGACMQQPQFTVITETNETHIYLICNNCKEMNIFL